MQTARGNSSLAKGGLEVESSDAWKPQVVHQPQQKQRQRHPISSNLQAQAGMVQPVFRVNEQAQAWLCLSLSQEWEALPLKAANAFKVNVNTK